MYFCRISSDFHPILYELILVDTLLLMNSALWVPYGDYPRGRKEQVDYQAPFTRAIMYRERRRCTGELGEARKRDRLNSVAERNSDERCQNTSGASMHRG